MTHKVLTRKAFLPSQSFYRHKGECIVRAESRDVSIEDRITLQTEFTTARR